MLQIGFVAAVVGACTHEALQLEQILGEQFAVFLLAFFLCHHVTGHHAGGHTGETFLQALFLGALHGCDALTDIVEHASQTEEILNALLHAQLEALYISFLEGHLDGVLDGGQEFNVNLILEQQGEKTCYKGHRSQSVKHMVSYVDVKLAFLLAGRQNQTTHDVVLESVKHGLGIRGDLNRVNAAFPCRLNPENGITGKGTDLFGQECRSIIFISGQGNHFPELTDRAGLFSFQNALAQTTGRPQFHLLQKQAVLNVHELIHAQGQKSAVLFPDFFF